MVERLAIALLSICLSVFIVIQLSNFGYLGSSPNLLTVDVEKIVRAHNTLIGKAAKSDFDAALNLNNVSDKVSEAIQAISGGQIVIISPVVVSKLENDITNEVLAYLDLPDPGAQGVQYIDKLDFPDLQEIEDYDAEKMLEVVEEFVNERERERELEEKESKLRQIIP